MFLLLTVSKQTDSFILPVATPRENGGSPQPSQSPEQQTFLPQNTQITEGGLSPMSNGGAEIHEEYVMAELTQSSPVTSADPLTRKDSHHMEQNMSEMEEIHQLPQRETSS